MLSKKAIALQAKIAAHRAECDAVNAKRAERREELKANPPVETPPVEAQTPIVEVAAQVKKQVAIDPIRKIDKNKYMQHWMKLRQKARTDLMYLAHDILQYKDIEEKPHRLMIEKMPVFKGGIDTMDEQGNVTYAPTERSDWKGSCTDIWHLEGPRKRLFLFPRGCLKTTVLTISGTIQWIINYPDIRVLLSMATGDQVVKVMGEVLSHFRFNETFRWLFPEFCPPAKGAKEFGNNDGFTVPNRRRKWMKEPTVSTCSVGKVVAGGHYEVICHSDLVDKENVKTPNQIIEVKSHFGYMDPLLERGDVIDATGSTKGWINVEGTRYDDDDLYGMIEDGEAKLEPEERSWQITVRSIEDPDKEHSLWPKRFPPSELRNLQAEPPRGIGIYQYAGQYLQKPVPAGSGLATRDMLKFKPRRFMQAILTRLHMTVDLAGMDPNSTGDDSVLTTAGFDRDGRMNVIDVRCGHFDPFEVIEMMFLLHKLYPQIGDIKVEKEAHSRVLLPFLRREQTKRGIWLPPIIPIQRDNRTSKKQRIKGLQPWFQSGDLIYFADEIGCKAEVILQITRFSVSSTYKDDILDTLADQMQNRDGGITYDVIPGGGTVDANAGKLPFPAIQFQGFDPETKAPMFWGEQSSTNEYYSKMTGI